MDKISKVEYEEAFKNKKKEALMRAWETRNFEIDMYWKRATYFWAFQVASFAGYFAILGSDFYNKMPPQSPQVLYFVCCIGLITSVAWTFINIGSKTWQRNWEIHVDMLEDDITGPLYKTIISNKTFSVSKINVLVSRFFIVIWILLILKYFIDHIRFTSNCFCDLDLLILSSTIVTAYFIYQMSFGYGRGRFSERQFKFYKRKYD